MYYEMIIKISLANIQQQPSHKKKFFLVLKTLRSILFPTFKYVIYCYSTFLIFYTEIFFPESKDPFRDHSTRL